MKRRKAAEVCVGGQRPRKKPKEGDNNMEFWKKISAAQRSDFLSSVQTQIAKSIRPKQFLSLEKKNSMVGREKEGEDLLMQIEGTCIDLNNSFTMVYGAPGSGKTFFVNEITKQFISEQQQRRQSKTKAIHTLSLNGKLHTNHRHSLQALLVQISGQEKRNGATQSQLKKLQLTEEDGKGTYRDQANHIMEVLKKRKKNKEATIMILDEFDLFVQQEGQKFLYFLANVHHVAVSLCLIAISSHQNILMGLEKRVRSRVTPLQLSLPSLSLSDVLTMMSTLFTVEDDGHFDEWEEDLVDSEEQVFSQFLERFNGCVKALFESEDMKNTLEPVYFRSRNLRTFCGMCANAVSSLTSAAPFPSLCHFRPTSSSTPSSSSSSSPSSSSLSPSSSFTTSTLSSFLPSWESTLRSFSETEAVIVAIMFILSKENGQLCTFEQIFSKYGESMGKIDNFVPYERGIIEKGFARLINCGVVVWVDERGKALRRCRLTLVKSQLQRLPLLCEALPEQMSRWMRKTIGQ